MPIGSIPPSGGAGFPAPQPGKRLISVDLDSDILTIISEADKAFEAKLTKEFNLDESIAEQDLFQIYDQGDPNELRPYFFHFIKAIPSLARHIDYNTLADKNEFQKVLGSIYYGRDFKTTSSTDKRLFILLIDQVLKAKALAKKEANSDSILDHILGSAIGFIYELSQPANLAISEKEAFVARPYIEKQIYQILGKMGENSRAAKQQYQQLIQEAIVDSHKFDDYVTRFVKFTNELDEARADDRTDPDSSAMYKFYAQIEKDLADKREGAVDTVKRAAAEFIRTNDKKVGFNGKFQKIFDDDFDMRDDATLQVNFPDWGEFDSQIFEKQVEVSLEYIDDFAKKGFEDLIFANYMREYGYDALAYKLASLEDMSAPQINKLIEDFLDPDQVSKSFRAFARKDSILELDGESLDEEIFINFLNELKKRVDEHKLRVHILPTAFDGDLDEELLNRKKIVFNAERYLGVINSTYNILTGFVKFNPWNLNGVDKDDYSTCFQSSYDQTDFYHSFQVQDAVPFAIYALTQDTDQVVSDGDVFTLAGVEGFHDLVEKAFVDDPIDKVSARFASYDRENDPDCYRVVFVEEQNDPDDDDFENEFDISPNPEGQLLLN